jgi:hypothetical protein
LKKLAQGKALGPDNTPNEIINALPPSFHDLLFLFLNNATRVNKYQLYGNTTKPYYSKKN